MYSFLLPESIDIIGNATVNTVVSEELFCSVPISIATTASALMKAGFDSVVGCGADFRNADIFDILATCFARSSHAWAETWRRIWGGRTEISRTKFSNDFFKGKMYHFDVEKL